MTTTIARVSDTTQAFSPDQVLGYSATRPSQNIIHQVVASPFVDATTNGVGLRTGQITLLFTSEAGKAAAIDVLKAADAFQLSTTDLTSISMRFVLSGTLVDTLDPETLAAWTVTFDFQELPSA